MSREERIYRILDDALNCKELQVINESHKHRGHAGDDGSGESHFRLKIVSDDFKNLSRIDRQRKINTLLNAEFESGLHALSLNLKDLSEVGG